MFLLNAEKTQLSVQAGEPLVSGAQNIYTCQFLFSKDWNDVAPTIVFRTRLAKISVLPDPNGLCSIPHEVLKVPHMDLQVGVYGTKNGELVLPTVWARLGKILTGTTLGDDTVSPEAGIYDQILAVANRAEEIARSVREDVDNGSLGGTPGTGGIKGEPAKLVSQRVDYQMSDSGTVCPSGAWSSGIPSVPQGKYLWTRTTLVFNSGEPVISYSVARMGMDGGTASGGVSTVNSVSPDARGNVELTAETVGALPRSGGDMTGSIRMQGHSLTGLAAPVNDTDAASKGYVDQRTAVLVRPNLLDNWYFRNPVNQRGVSGTVSTAGYFLDRWKLTNGTVQITDSGLVLNGTMVQIQESAIDQPVKASVLTSGGIADGSYDDASKTFSITAAGQTIVAAKLELGDTLTLAHQDADGKWLLNELPDYGEQLARCQRYYCRADGIYPALSFSNDKNLLLKPSLLASMRTTPSLSINKISWIRGKGVNITTFGSYTVATYSNSANQPAYELKFSSVIGLGNLEMGMVFVYAELSADL